MGSEQSHPANSGSNQGASNSFTTGDLSAFSASLRDRDGAMSPRYVFFLKIFQILVKKKEDPKLMIMG